MRQGKYSWNIEQKEDGYWVSGFECGELGPYRTQAGAQEDARGVARFYRDFDKEFKSQKQGRLWDAEEDPCELD